MPRGSDISGSDVMLRNVGSLSIELSHEQNDVATAMVGDSRHESWDTRILGFHHRIHTYGHIVTFF
jgi:hypothetical protein